MKIGRAICPLRVSSTALLTTYRRDGTAVPTAVSIVLDDDRAYFVSAAGSGKAKRLARDPDATLAACTTSGRVVGEAVRVRVHLLDRAERRQVRHLLRPTRALFWSFVLYRLRGHAMNLYEAAPAEGGDLGGDRDEAPTTRW